MIRHAPIIPEGGRRCEYVTRDPLAECTSDDPTNHQGDTCPVHEGARCNLLPEEHDPSDALQEALEGFADSNRDLFREYVNGWHDNAADILAEWEG